MTDLMEQLTEIAKQYYQTAPLSVILAPDGDQCEIISPEKAHILSARAAALEQRLADLRGVSDANEGLAGALGRERRRADEMQGQRDQAIEHVRRLNTRLAEADVNAARYEALRHAFSYDSLSGWFDDEPTPEAETDAIADAMKQEADALRADALGCTVDGLPERVAAPEGSNP